MCFFAFFWSFYLGLIFGKLSICNQGRCLKAWEIGEGMGRGGPTEWVPPFKDYFASRKCKVLGRNSYTCLYLCLCSKPSELWKELWNLKSKVGYLMPWQCDLEQLHLFILSFLICKMGSCRKATEIQITYKIFHCASVNKFL